MGQRYVRAVTTAGGLSIPDEVTRDDALPTTLTDHSWTFAASALITVYVTGANAEVEFHNGVDWTGETQPCYLGMNEFPCTSLGVRFRNIDGDAATSTISVARYTA